MRKNVREVEICMKKEALRIVALLELIAYQCPLRIMWWWLDLRKVLLVFGRAATQQNPFQQASQHKLSINVSSHLRGQDKWEKFVHFH